MIEEWNILIGGARSWHAIEEKAGKVIFINASRNKILYELVTARPE